MTLTELRYIIAVADEKHFGRAAAKCFVSQPTLSIGVKRLEDELGVTLFERSKTSVHLTAVACLLYTSPSPRDRTRSRMPSSA